MSSNTVNLWSSLDGKGFAAEYADYASCASTDDKGNQIDTTYATKSETDTLLGGKQDNLTFDGTYDATTNPVATVSTVESTIPASTSSDEGKVLAVNASGSHQWTQLPWVATDYQIPPETIKIGDKYYRIVTIGNQQWMAENLDYVWNGLTADSYAPGCYYVSKKTNYSNNDQSKYGAYGRLYDWYAAKNLNDNLSTILGTKLATDGWHIPSQADFDALITYVGGTSTAGTKLKMTSIGGTDDYGFSWQPSGIGQDSGGGIAYYRWGAWGLIWSLYESNSSNAYAYAVYYDATSCGTRSEPKLCEASIRLVRNLT